MNRVCRARPLSLSFISILLTACHYPTHWRDRGGWDHGTGMMGWFGPFGMIIFWIVAIVVLVLLVRWIMMSGRVSQNGGPQETALDILKKRYAGGEITREEFERMKRDLDG